MTSLPASLPSLAGEAWHALVELRQMFNGPALAGAIAQNTLLHAAMPHLDPARSALIKWATATASAPEEDAGEPYADLIVETLRASPLGQASLNSASRAELQREMHRSPFQGDTAFQQLMSYLVWDMGVARAYRSQVRVVTDILATAAAQADESGKPLRVLQLGAASGTEVAEYLMHAPGVANARMSLTLADPDSAALLAADAFHRGILANIPRAVTLEYTARPFDSLLESAHTGEPYDLVIAAGCLDLLPNTPARELTEQCVHALAVGGTALWTSAQAPVDRHLHARCFGQARTYRTADQVLEVLPSGPRFMLSLITRPPMVTATAQRVR